MRPKKLTPEEDTSPALENKVTKRIQHIVGALLYYATSVYNKLLVRLSVIGTQQAAATQHTNKVINRLLDYSATYPTGGILYRSSDMVLCAHPDAGFYDENKDLSRADAPKMSQCQIGMV